MFWLPYHFLAHIPFSLSWTRRVGSRLEFVNTSDRLCSCWFEYFALMQVLIKKNLAFLFSLVCPVFVRCTTHMTGFTQSIRIRHLIARYEKNILGILSLDWHLFIGMGVRVRQLLRSVITLHGNEFRPYSLYLSNKINKITMCKKSL